MTNLIPVVVLKNFEPQLSYILVEIFNMCLKGSCFPDCWNISSVVSVFKNVGKRSTAKNYCQLLANYQYVSLLSVVSKVFEKLVNKCGLFSDFKYCFRSSQSTADLLRVISDRIARAFMRSGVLELQHLIYPRISAELGMLVFSNIILMGCWFRYLALFLLYSVIDQSGLHKNIQLMLEFFED